MKIEEKYITPQIEGGSLIGVGGTAPHSWGNYFWMNGGKRVLNMWMENLEDAIQKFLPDGKVKVRDYGSCLIIIDDRIPKEYYSNKLCFTGARDVTKEIAEDAYKTLGDPENEFEQFTNPKEYHRKRGGYYREIEINGIVTGLVSKKAGGNPNARKLNGEWKCEVSNDDAIINYFSL